VSIGILRGNARANEVAGGLPFEAFPNRSAHFRKLRLRLALER
jgi:hypothetical protein